MPNYLKFWGTRGSSSVSGENYREFGGNTSCLEICYEGRHVVIDAGTGILPLGKVLKKENVKEMDLFFSHAHWDHIIGLPFFDPIYDPEMKITIWSLENQKRPYHELLEEVFSWEFFPVKFKDLKSKIELRCMHFQKPVQLGNFTIESHKANHPSATCCFKFHFSRQKIAYVTDNELLPKFHGDIETVSPNETFGGILDFLKDCDIVIHECQYFPEEYTLKEGWGHSSVNNAAALMRHLKPPRWIIVHHDPGHSDKDLHRLRDLAEQLLKGYGVKVELLGDGAVLNLK